MNGTSSPALLLQPAHTREAKLHGRRIAVLTAYDYPGARLLEEAGVDWVLVGDSLGMVVLGFPDTTHVTLAHMLHHTAAAARGLTHTPLIADLPFGTYDTVDDALKNARALLAAGAHAVKLEGGASHTDRVSALVDAGIPVMGHIGMLPQSVKAEGGYRIKGKTPAEAEKLLGDALALEACGVFSMVLELVEAQSATHISKALKIPTIGIGSGTACDGQVLVTHDLVGAFPWFAPKFAKPLAATGAAVRDAAASFVERTRGAPNRLL